MFPQYTKSTLADDSIKCHLLCSNKQYYTRSKDKMYLVALARFEPRVGGSKVLKLQAPGHSTEDGNPHNQNTPLHTENIKT